MIFNENGKILNEGIFTSFKNKFFSRKSNNSNKNNLNTNNSNTKSFEITESMAESAVNYFKKEYNKIMVFTKNQLMNLTQNNDLDGDYYFKIYKFNTEDGWKGIPTGLVNYDDSYFVSPDKYQSYQEWSKNLYRWWFIKDAMLMCKLETYLDDGYEFGEHHKIDNVQEKLLEILFTETKKYKYIYTYEVNDCEGIYIGLRLTEYFNIT